MIKQSLCLPIFRLTIDQLDNFLTEIKSIGYVGVEFWELPEDFEERFEIVCQHDLRITSFTGHRSILSGFNDESQHDWICSELTRSLDIAKKWNIPGVICFAGNRIAGQTDIDGLRICARGLRKILPYAQEKKVNLNLELLNSRVDHYNYLGDRSSWGFALCELVNHSYLKLLFDIYHMQIMEGDIIRSITQHIQYIGHFHTAGNPGRNLFDDHQELNYRGICSAIARTGYQGYVGHEFFPRPGEDPYTLLRRAFEICNV